MNKGSGESLKGKPIFWISKCVKTDWRGRLKPDPIGGGCY